jgi:hypothetical protein
MEERYRVKFTGPNNRKQMVTCGVQIGLIEFNMMGGHEEQNLVNGGRIQRPNRIAP